MYRARLFGDVAFAHGFAMKSVKSRQRLSRQGLLEQKRLIDFALEFPAAG